MAQVLALHWWAWVLRGLVAVIFGLIAFFIPGATLFALTILFGAYALIDGIVSLAAAIRSARRGEHWWALLFEGIAGLCAAAATALWPLLTLIVLVYIVGAWAFITGIFEIVAAFRLRRFIRGEWLLALTGVFSIVFGILILAAPITGAIVLAWWIGAYVFIFGLMLIGLGFRLRRWRGTLSPQHA